ncbi:MAG: hypothetical protein H0W06_08905, partial [Chloroflexia bacterium]|nr:hypothetical protein [Chloroflexia bacterium]
MSEHQSCGNNRPFSGIVTVDWLFDHIEDGEVAVVDVRPAGAYSLGHIAGAIDLDLNALQLNESRPESIHTFNERARVILCDAGISPEHRVVFYEEFSGAMAARGVWLLDYLGLRNGAMLDGGLRAWDAVGGTITTEPVMPTP